VLGYEARTSNVGWTNSRIKLMQLSFQILIDEKESLKCSVHVAIAGCDDLFDNNFSPPGSHP